MAHGVRGAVGRRGSSVALGIPNSRIVELDWWQSIHVGGIGVVATPARHRSGRIATQANKTLWAGYAIAGAQHRAWYSGDTGLHEDLARIGERHGPFDITMIESGQYDAGWPDTHLGPELAIEADFARFVSGKTTDLRFPLKCRSDFGRRSVVQWNYPRFIERAVLHPWKLHRLALCANRST